LFQVSFEPPGELGVLVVTVTEKDTTMCRGHRESKQPFSLSGAISPDRRVVNRGSARVALSCVDKTAFSEEKTKIEVPLSVFRVINSTQASRP
jgi:hypothetical protein